MGGHTPEVPLRPGPTFRNTETITHLVLWTAVFFTFAFYKTLPSLQQKLLGALLTPVRHPALALVVPLATELLGAGMNFAVFERVRDSANLYVLQVVVVYFLVPSHTKHSAPSVRTHMYKLSFSCGGLSRLLHQPLSASAMLSQVLIQCVSMGVLGFLLQRFLARGC